MRFENISRKKENVKYNSGEVLVVYNEAIGKVEAYMVIRRYDKYNILNLNNGEVYYNDDEDYDDFVRELERLFYPIETVDNDELGLVRVED